MNAREWLRRQRSMQAPAQRQLFLEAVATPRIEGRTPAGEAIACGCWPQYITCRYAVRAESGA